MSQVEPLILPVDTRQVKDGEKALDGLTAAGGRAQRATELMRTAAIAAGAAVGTATSAIALMTKQSIDAADAMNDLHLRTGIAFKSLAAYDLLARQSGTSINGMAQGFKFLSRYMVEHGDKLRAIGVTSKDTNVAMGQFADVIQRIEDPALRTALAMEVLGRSGDELIPAILGGSEAMRMAESATAAYGVALGRAAPLSDEFNDLIEVGQTHVKTFGLNLAADLLPPLIESARYFLEAGEEIDGFNVAGEAGKIVVQTLAVLLANLSFVAQGVGREIGGIAAQLTALATGDLAGFTAIGDAMKDDAAKAREALDEFERRVMATGDAAGEAETKVRGLSDAEKSRIESLLRGKTAQDEAEKKAREWLETIKRETDQIGLDTEQKRMMEAATVALTVKSAALRAEIMGAAGAWSAKVTALAAAAAATKRLREQEDNYAERLNAAMWKQMDAEKALEDRIKDIEHETKVLTADATKLRELIILRELERSGIDKSTQAYEEYRMRLDAAMARRDTTKDLVSQQVDMWKEVDRVAHDTFVSIFDSGKSAFDRLRDTLKNGLYSLLYQMTVKPFLIQIATSVGGSSVAGQAFGSGGNLFSMGSNAYSLANGGGGLYSSFAGSSLGQSIGLSQGTLMGPTVTGEALGGTAFTAFGSALPYIAAAAAIASMFSKESTPHVGGLAFGSESGFVSPDTGDAVLQYLSNSSRANSRVPLSAYNFTENDWFARENRAVSDQLGNLSQSLARQVNSITRQYGAGSGYSVGLAYSADGEDGSRGRFGIVKDGALVASSRQRYDDDMQQGLTEFFADIPSEIVQGLRDMDLSPVVNQFLDMSMSGTTDILEGMSDATANALLGALQGGWLDEFLGQMDMAGQSFSAITDQIAEFSRVANLKPIFDALGLSIYKVGTQLADLAGGADALESALSAYYDAFYTAEEQRANTLSQITAEFDKWGATVPSTREEFRALVDTVAAMGPAGVEAYAALIAIAPAFASVVDAVETTTDATRDIVAEAERNARDAVSAFARSIELAKQPILESMKLAQQVVEKARAISDVAANASATLRTSVSTTQSRADFDAILAAARGGNLPDLQQLQRAIAGVTNIRTETFTSRADYTRATIIQANKLDELRDLADNQGDSAQRQVDLAQRQLDEMQRQVDLAQQQLDALMGINTGIASLSDVFAALTNLAQVTGRSSSYATAMAAAGAANVANMQASDPYYASQRTDITSQALNAATQGNVESTKALASEALQWGTAQQIAAEVARQTGDSSWTADKLTTWARENNVPGYANGGTARGLFAAGERGAELMYSPSPIRVLNNQDSKAAVIEGGQITDLLASIARDSRDTKDLLRRVTRDGDSLVTTPA